MTTYEPTDGSVVHIDLLTNDIDAAREFYAAAFDWRVEVDEEFDYVMWEAPNPPAGGLMETEESPLGEPGTILYLQVSDLDETVNAITAAGGTITMPETEVPGHGAFIMFEAPGEVVLAAWESRSPESANEDEAYVFTDEAELHDIVHFEFYTTDPGATQHFLEEVFDWEFEAMPDPSGEGDYILASPPTPPMGGLMQATDEMPVGTLIYMKVSSADGGCEAVSEAGGMILEDPFEIAGWGTMAVFQAPGGTVHALWEAAPDAEYASGEPQPTTD